MNRPGNVYSIGVGPAYVLVYFCGPKPNAVPVCGVEVQGEDRENVKDGVIRGTLIKNNIKEMLYNETSVTGNTLLNGTNDVIENL